MAAPQLFFQTSSTMAERAKIRYAVVGLGHIAQVAVLPAFAHARQNSQLTALVSDDPVKHEKLRSKYKVQHTYSYEEYDKCLSSGAIDAVYIALPNNLHCDFTVRAARAGIHVLCEKPMAVTEDDCEKMISAAEKGGVKLMIAYRLHFEKANLEAVEIARSGKLGEPRFFSSVFAMQVKEDNIRLETGARRRHALRYRRVLHQCSRAPCFRPSRRKSTRSASAVKTRASGKSMR